MKTWDERLGPAPSTQAIGWVEAYAAELGNDLETLQARAAGNPNQEPRLTRQTERYLGQLLATPESAADMRPETALAIGALASKVYLAALEHDPVGYKNMHKDQIWRRFLRVAMGQTTGDIAVSEGVHVDRIFDARSNFMKRVLGLPYIGTVREALSEIVTASDPMEPRPQRRPGRSVREGKMPHDNYATVGDRTLRAYLRAASGQTLLQPQEESEASIIIQNGLRARRGLEAGRMDNDTAQPLIEAAEETIELFVDANRGLVGRAALARLHRLENLPHLNISDLLMEGEAGLRRAVKNFNVTSATGYTGNKFSAFAMPYINGAMNRYLRAQASQLSIPHGMAERVQQVRRIFTRVEAETGQSPSMRSVAEELGLTTEQVAEAYYTGQRIDSLSVEEEANSPVHRDVEQPAPTATESVPLGAFRDHPFFAGLSPRQYAIFMLATGIADGRAILIEDIPEELRIISEQMEQEARERVIAEQQRILEERQHAPGRKPKARMDNTYKQFIVRISTVYRELRAARQIIAKNLTEQGITDPPQWIRSTAEDTTPRSGDNPE